MPTWVSPLVCSDMCICVRVLTQPRVQLYGGMGVWGSCMGDTQVQTCTHCNQVNSVQRCKYTWTCMHTSSHSPTQPTHMQTHTQGETNRVIGEHQLNRESSRSHSIFTIALEMRGTGGTDSTVVVRRLVHRLNVASALFPTSCGLHVLASVCDNRELSACTLLECLPSATVACRGKNPGGDIRDWVMH